MEMSHQQSNGGFIGLVNGDLNMDEAKRIETSFEETPTIKLPSLESIDHPVDSDPRNDPISFNQALAERPNISNKDASLKDSVHTYQAPSEEISPLIEDASTTAHAPFNHTPSETIHQSMEQTPSEGPVVTTSAPSIATHHPLENASLKDPISSDQALSEPTIETEETNELAVNAPTVGDNLHPGISQPAVEVPLEESLTAKKRSDHESPDPSALRAEHVSVLPEPKAAVEAQLGPFTNAEPTIDPKESKTVVPAVDDGLITSNIASAPQHSSREEGSADIIMEQTEPVLEALPRNEASVAENPASAVAAINNAASELNHIMEQHRSNKNAEVDHGSPKSNWDSISYAHSGPPEGDHDETQHYEKAPPPAGNDSSFLSDPSPAFQVDQAIQTPMDVHEPMGVQPEAETPVDSIPADPIPADTEMDDGSSVSTIHAYLGAHAPSLGTGSVDGNPGDTLIDDGDSALGDDVES